MEFRSGIQAKITWATQLIFNTKKRPLQIKFLQSLNGINNFGRRYECVCVYFRIRLDCLGYKLYIPTFFYHIVIMTYFLLIQKSIHSLIA